MKHRKISGRPSALPLVLVASCTILVASTAICKPRYVTFDVDGGGDTHVSDINSRGEVTGWTLDAAFVREADGTIVTFSVPGYLSPQATSMNKYGDIAGIAYTKIGNYPAGFVRAPDGTITVFSASDDPEDDTQVWDINANGQIVGFFSTPDEVHGYLREPDGSVTPFDAPGATETEPTRINNKRMIAGTYSTAGSVHGFVRSSRGKIVSFDVPDARFLLVTGLTDAGWTSGITINSETQSFVRSPDGTVTVFAVDGKQTETECANRAGTLAGAYGNPDGHGYLRTISGEISVFGIPRTKTGIYSACINDDGVVAGDYHPQKSALRYGYIRYP